MREAGIYIVEDLHLHSGPFGHQYRGSSEMAPVDLFLQIARHVSCPEDTTSENYRLMHATDAVEFFYGGVTVRKKPLAETDPISPRRPLVEAANKAEMWAGFAMYILRVGGDLDEALSCIRRAIAQKPQDAGYQHHLGQLLERKGDLASALTRCARGGSPASWFRGLSGRIRKAAGEDNPVRRRFMVGYGLGLLWVAARHARSRVQSPSMWYLPARLAM